MGNPHLSNFSLSYPPRPPLPSPVEQRAARLAWGRVVIVCGGRENVDPARIFAALDRAHERAPITLLVHGACLDLKKGELCGVDRWADEWAVARGVPVERHPVDTATWGPGAEAMRNKQMAESGAHGCIAFPAGDTDAGSAVMQAERHRIPVWRPFG
jgi:hypothetical protein